jgi:hypothetical protein
VRRFGGISLPVLHKYRGTLSDAVKMMFRPDALTDADGGLGVNPHHGGDGDGSYGPELAELDCAGLLEDAQYHEELAAIQTAAAAAGVGDAAAAAESLDLAGEAVCEWCKRGCPGSESASACDGCGSSADIS